jgi:hypothetical protein
MQKREFLAILRPNVDLAAWAAAPYGWSARPAARNELVAMVAPGRAVELFHARSPVGVVLIETPAAGPTEVADGAFLYLSGGFDDAEKLSSLLGHPTIAQLVSALGAVARRTRAEPELIS